MHDLTFIRRLGVGARGTVWLATASGASPADAPMQLAVKVQPREEEDTQVEVTALKRLNGHPNILSLLVRPTLLHAPPTPHPPHPSHTSFFFSWSATGPRGVFR